MKIDYALISNKESETTIENYWDDPSLVWMTNPRWVCQIDERGYDSPKDDIHLGLLVETIDLREIDMEYDEWEYFLMLSPEIFVVPEDMHPDYKKRCMQGDDHEFCLLDAKFYSGGVYAYNQLEGITSKAQTSAKFQMREFPNGDMGRLFKEWEEAEKYAREIYAPHCDALFGLIGFMLDQPVNMIGNTGWDTIRLQATNVKEDVWAKWRTNAKSATKKQ